MDESTTYGPHFPVGNADCSDTIGTVTVTPDDSRTLGANIRAARERRGLQQNDFAAMLGVANPSLNQWEKDKAVPTLDSLFKIAKVLDVSIESLVAGIDAEYDAQRNVGVSPERLWELYSQVEPEDVRTQLLRLMIASARVPFRRAHQ
jgi:transcriptional regulator with XRE-family HTH domain